MKLIAITRKTQQAGLLRLAAGCLLLGLTAAMLASGAARAEDGSCDGRIPPQQQKFGGPKGDTNSQPNLKIDKPCWTDTAGTYVYGNINIIGPNGSLEFRDPAAKGSQVNFWAKNIIVENGGTLKAGTATAPYGSRGGVLTIYLYGADQTKGLDPNSEAGQAQGWPCRTDTSEALGVGPCGIPTKKTGGNDTDGAWSNNGQTPVKIDGYPTNDYFYQYGPLPGDMRCTDPNAKPNDPPPQVFWKVNNGIGACTNPKFQAGYFGYKVLAVSYGGTLQFFGYKGTPLPKAPPPPPTRRFRFFGNQGTFNPQGAMGAPSQFASQSAPGTSGTGSPGGLFFKWFHGHFGNGGGGNGGGGHHPCPSPSTASATTASCGGGGGGGGLGGEAGTCASDLTVGTNTKLTPDDVPTSTGCSWLRLAATTDSVNLNTGATQLKLSNGTGDRWWSSDDPKSTPDEFVVTTTDYLPGHSEKLTITNIDKDGNVTFTPALAWPHRGTRFPIAGRLDTNKQRFLDAGMDPDLINNGAETRAAVALLTRSIRIVSGGDGPNDDFEKDDGPGDAAKCQSVADQIPDPWPAKLPSPPKCYSFGGHVVFRQGFKSVQIQGVEFAKLGQPGKKGHYPIHFHMARQVPPNTFVKDSTINESMTRWIVLHSTQGVLLQRNIGYKSIGHGFYLESGTETDNKFYSNLGIFARAAVDNPQNPRKLPGILAYTGENFAKYIDPEKGPIFPPLPDTAFPWRSDYMFPTVFWITNGWNDFIGNMAAGAGACGAAYWLVPAWNTDMPDVAIKGNTQFDTHMKWNGFAALQKTEAYQGSTPLKSFYGNFATSTMTSFQTVGQTSGCPGATWPGDPAAHNPGIFPGLKSFAPTPEAPANTELDMYYPHVGGGGRMATMCPKGGGGYDCTLFTSGQMSVCGNGASLKYCAVTVLDHFTSSFHWAQTNFAAIWLRPQWYLVDNSVLTDVQNGGLSFITSGTYDRSAVVEGDWAVVRTSLFIGNTQDETKNSFASNRTAFQQTFSKGLPCQNGRQPSLMCANANEGVSLPVDNFAVGQRLFNIYDGPAYQESNIYLDISTADCKECVYSRMPGIRKQTKSDKTVSCYLPNAAIGWKQPNGFFYPPSFHSTNLFFGNVDIRHYVIDALFKKGTYLDDIDTSTQPPGGQIPKDYCDFSGTYPTFRNFSDIDRQTELNDDDGSLTGLTNDATALVNKISKSVPTGTISVNPVEFFDAPVETAECLSNIGVTPNLACPVNKVLPATPTPAGAKTSPYDYVTTVVFPEKCQGPIKKIRACGDDNTTVGGAKDYTINGNKTTFVQYTQQLGRGGDWSQECTNPACYGVPLYRQFLTGTTSTSRELQTWNTNCKTDAQKATAACRWPFVRMGGQATYQRSTLTANHGTYFLDTSVSKTTQNGEAFTTTLPCGHTPPTADDKDCSPRSVNVFIKGQTYDMFFLFAKPATKQTYQIYVGKTGFNLASDVKAIRAKLDSMPPVIDSTNNNIPWPTNWTKNYNDTTACANFKVPTDPCGILQITVDFSDQTDLDPKSQCKPTTFCVKKDPGCGCALTESDPLALADPVRMDSTGTKVLFGGILGACEKACSQWAVKDLDFPTNPADIPDPKKNGPLGFSFKMAVDADDQGYLHRPTPQPFPTTKDRNPQISQPDPDWLTMFAATAVEPDKSKGECRYPSIPTNGPGTCQIP